MSAIQEEMNRRRADEKSLKILYALCYILMGDDKPDDPQIPVGIRNFLVREADEEAKRRGFDGWISFYMDTTMPFTKEDLEAAS